MKASQEEPTETFGKLDNLDDLIGTEAEISGYRVDYEIDEQRLKKLLKQGVNFIPKPMVIREFKIKEDKNKIFIQKLVPAWNRQTKIIKIGFCRRGIIKRDYQVVYKGTGIILSWKAGVKEVKNGKRKPDKDVE